MSTGQVGNLDLSITPPGYPRLFGGIPDHAGSSNKANRTAGATTLDELELDASTPGQANHKANSDPALLFHDPNLHALHAPAPTPAPSHAVDAVHTAHFALAPTHGHDHSHAPTHAHGARIWPALPPPAPSPSPPAPAAPAPAPAAPLAPAAPAGPSAGTIQTTSSRTTAIRTSTSPTSTSPSPTPTTPTTLSSTTTTTSPTQLLANQSRNSQVQPPYGLHLPTVHLGSFDSLDRSPFTTSSRHPISPSSSAPSLGERDRPSARRGSVSSSTSAASRPTSRAVSPTPLHMLHVQNSAQVTDRADLRPSHNPSSPFIPTAFAHTPEPSQYQHQQSLDAADLASTPARVSRAASPSLSAVPTEDNAPTPRPAKVPPQTPSVNTNQAPSTLRPSPPLLSPISPISPVGIDSHLTNLPSSSFTGNGYGHASAKDEHPFLVGQSPWSPAASAVPPAAASRTATTASVQSQRDLPRDEIANVRSSSISSLNSLNSVASASGARARSALSVHTPSPLTPTRRSFDVDFGGTASPRLRDSPSVPRRRTIIQQHKHASHVHVAQVETETEHHLSTPASPSPLPAKGLAPTAPSNTNGDLALSAPAPNSAAVRSLQPSASPPTAFPITSRNVSSSPTSIVQDDAAFASKQAHDLPDSLIDPASSVPARTRATAPLLAREPASSPSPVAPASIPATEPAPTRAAVASPTEVTGRQQGIEASDDATATGTASTVHVDGQPRHKPSKKRSLPRPPTTEDSSALTSSSPATRATSQTIPFPTPGPSTNPSLVSMPVPTVASRPLSTSPKANFNPNGRGFGVDTAPQIRSRNRSPDRVGLSSFFATTGGAIEMPTAKAAPMPATKPVPMPTPMGFAPSHQPTKSASNFPAIAGLSDAGPYPTSAVSPKARAPPNGLQVPGANGGPPGLPQGLRQPEEVCLECMMRDRDLADVCVQGEGVWERASDAAWQDLREREFETLRAMSLDHSVSGMSLESAGFSAEADSSPLSHASGLPEEPSRAAQAAARRHRREARKAKADERDAQVARIGWRGFKWEEGSGGDGFPKGFLGTRGGALTEKGIKNVMTMYPSSSALRYQILQSYLRGQYRLILEVRNEAARLGHYPEPEEPYYPTSPTLSSHESSLASANRRKSRNKSIDAQSVKAMSISTARSAPAVPLSQQPPPLRQSPSTPAGLGSVVTQRPRPRTQYSGERGGERESMLAPSSSSVASRPLLNVNTSTSPPTRPQHLKGMSVSSSSVPKARDSRFTDDCWSDTEDLWPPASPASGNLRPFSFAVRAGAAAGRDGSDAGHQRRSIFGRWGGSVTSLFTGSHGGSGSMMDMHLGLDMDRRNRTSSYQAHEMPKVSAGLAPRPVFASRQSLGSGVYLAGQDEQTANAAAQAAMRDRRARSVSTSRLTQVSLYDEPSDVSPKKKEKGLKGLLQKMKKPKGKRDRAAAVARPEEDGGSSELQPPPPISFLVNRGERSHDRSRSGSSMSMLNEPSPSPSLTPGNGSPNPQGRSVSTPMAASSGSGSQDASPTSSRFAPERDRRRTDPSPELPPGAAPDAFSLTLHPRRGSAMEMLTGSSHTSIPNALITPETPVYEEPISMRDSSFSSSLRESMARDSMVARESMVRDSLVVRDSMVGRESTYVPNGNGQPYPPSYNVAMSYRKSMQPSLSSRYSTADSLDPGMAPAQHLQAPSPAGSLSPNRYKNLPPLPPSAGGGGLASPDMYSDAADSYRASVYDNRTSIASSYPRDSIVSQDAPSIGYRAGVPPSSDYFPTASPRYQQGGFASPLPVPGPGSSPPGGYGAALGAGPGNVGLGAPPYMQQRTLQPRASFDVLADHRARVRRSTAAPMPDERNAQSMYIDARNAASTGSFGRFLKSEKAVVPDPPPHTEDRKERRRGIKSIFSKAK